MATASLSPAARLPKISSRLRGMTIRTWFIPANKPMLATGGVVGLRGNLAPDGAIVKVAGMQRLRFSGPARCFDGEEACFDAVKNKTYREGEVLVIRYEGPRAGPACAKC